MERLFLAAFLTMLVHLLITFSYSIRLAGLRTKRLLTAVSIFNILFLLAGLFNTLQAPLLTSVVEHSIKTAALESGATVPGDQLILQEAYKQHLSILADRIRLVIAASTLGSVAGAALTPSFTGLLTRAIRLFEEVGSAPRVLIRIFWRLPRPQWEPVRLLLRNGCRSLAVLSRQKMNIPKAFLAANIFSTGLFTVGVLSALYAGALYPEFRSTTTVLSAFVSGIAVSLNAVVVEPTAGLITDEAMRGEREHADVKQMTLFLLITRILGTLLAQLIFLPVAFLIKFIALLFSR